MESESDVGRNIPRQTNIPEEVKKQKKNMNNNDTTDLSELISNISPSVTPVSSRQKSPEARLPHRPDMKSGRKDVFGASRKVPSNREEDKVVPKPQRKDHFSSLKSNSKHTNIKSSDLKSSSSSSHASFQDKGVINQHPVQMHKHNSSNNRD